MVKTTYEILKDKFKKTGLTTLIVLVILVFGIFKVYGSGSFEVDVTATVYKVIDGDTFDAFPVGRVRLADVNAPELNEKGGIEAKEALIKLVQGRKVYLDVDDKYVMDRYYRLVCVVYVRVDSERLLNVNKWLLENNYVYLVDFDNEFTPSKWNLYEYYSEEESEKTTISLTITEFHTVTVTELLTTTLLATTLSTNTITVTSPVSSTVTISFPYTVTEVGRIENEDTYYLRLIIVILLIALAITLMLSASWRRR
jgi:endonuclease YncB( thermonuclease family)